MAEDVCLRAQGLTKRYLSGGVEFAVFANLNLEVVIGEKLALVSWEKDGEVCCISLVKADELTGMVKGLLGPMMEGIITG